MNTIHKAGGATCAGAALVAALLIAGTSLSAHAAGENSAKDDAAKTDDMSVREAWSNAKQDWRALQNASGEAVSEARQQFQESWSRLQKLMSERDGTAPPPDDPSAPAQGTNAD